MVCINVTLSQLQRGHTRVELYVFRRCSTHNRYEPSGNAQNRCVAHHLWTKHGEWKAWVMQKAAEKKICTRPKGTRKREMSNRNLISHDDGQLIAFCHKRAKLSKEYYEISSDDTSSYKFAYNVKVSGRRVDEDVKVSARALFYGIVSRGHSSSLARELCMIYAM